MTKDQMDISLKADGGVLKQIISEGTGTETPAPGLKIKVHYVGTLTDGTKFDSSRDRAEPFEFNLGKGNVIKAWDIGVATMRKGEVAVFTCAPEYAYGKQGSPPTIPPDSTLKFEIEVLDWRGEDISPKRDGGIERYQIKAGDGFGTPNDGALVHVHLVGIYNDKVFDDRSVSFNIGEGAKENICDGVERSIERFKIGECSRVILQPKYAFGKEGKQEWNIPPNAVVEYNITLNSFEKAKECWSLDSAERVQQAGLFKNKGTEYFKTEKYELAIKMYKKVLSFLEYEKDANSSIADERKGLQISTNLNLSLCYLKLKQYFEARESATAAIKLSKSNVKAYFRRGQAQLVLGEAKLALNDFNQVLSLEPNNKAAQSQVIVCQTIIKQQLQKEKEIYANMFDKFAKVDAQKEEEIRRQQPDVMKTLGEWGEEERERAPTDFEKENPNILMLNGNGEFKDM